MQCPPPKKIPPPPKPSKGVQHPTRRGHGALIWAPGGWGGGTRAAPHFLCPQRSQSSRGCRGAAKGAAEQGAAMSYLLLPPGGHRARPLPAKERLDSLPGGETFSLGKSRQQPRMTAGTAVTPPGSACTLWHASLPLCLPVPGRGVTLPPAAPPASCPYPPPRPPAMLWDGENSLERVKACVIFLHVKSHFLGPCQAGRAEDEAGQRTRQGGGPGAGWKDPKQSLPSAACKLPCYKEAHVPPPRHQRLQGWRGWVAQVGGRAVLPAGDREGTMQLEPKSWWLCSSEA